MQALRSTSTRIVTVGLAAAAGGLAVALVTADPAGSTIPVEARIGTITYNNVSGSTDVTKQLRSFTWYVENTPTTGTGGGGGDGKALFSLPQVVEEVGSTSPLLLRAAALGVHLPTVVIVLNQPSSTKPAQRLTFSEATVASVRVSQKGPSSAVPSETVTVGYNKVNQEILATDGTTIVRTFCFDIVGNVGC